MAKLSDDATITRALIDSLDLSVRAQNVVLNNFLGATVADLRGAMADRRRPVLHCGRVTTEEIQSALDGELHLSPQAAERRVAQIKAEAEARIARLRTRAAKDMGVEWRP